MTHKKWPELRTVPLDADGVCDGERVSDGVWVDDGEYVWLGDRLCVCEAVIDDDSDAVADMDGVVVGEAPSDRV